MLPPTTVLCLHQPAGYNTGVTDASSPIHVACMLCGAHGPQVLYDGLHLVRCSACGLAYVDPQPSDAALAALYTDGYFTRPAVPGEPLYVDNQAGLERFFDGRLIQLERLVGPGCLLEIGSNLGYLLHVAGRRGWKAIGLELSDFAVRYAREHFGVDARCTPLAEAGFGDGAFDAVVMRDVLEHVRDPRAILSEVRRVLRPGGFLGLSMPNFASLAAQLGGPHWRHLRPEQHLFHFAPATLRRLLAECGFEIVEMESRYDSPAVREVYAALADAAQRRRLAWHAALRGDIVFLPLGTHRRRVLRAGAVALDLLTFLFRSPLLDDILEVHAQRPE